MTVISNGCVLFSHVVVVIGTRKGLIATKGKYGTKPRNVTGGLGRKNGKENTDV